MKYKNNERLRYRIDRKREGKFKEKRRRNKKLKERKKENEVKSKN